MFILLWYLFAIFILLPFMLIITWPYLELILGAVFVIFIYKFLRKYTWDGKLR